MNAATAPATSAAKAAQPPVSVNPTPPGNRPLRMALLGNPNCGKTALFNLLTGSHQKVANYAGVTVERKQGRYTAQATLGGQAPMPLQLAAEAQLAIPAQQDTAAGAGAGADTDATQTNADAADSTPPRPAHAFQARLPVWFWNGLLFQ